MNDLTGTEPAVTTVAAAGTGLTAGVYLAFAVMVMPALTHADPASALAAMQRINTLAQRSVFGLVFAAAAIGSAWVLAAPWFDAGDRQAWPTIGAVLSLTAFLITAGVNLPRNRRMTALDPGSPADLGTWRTISGQWRKANTVRAGCATLGLVAFLM